MQKKHTKGGFMKATKKTIKFVLGLGLWLKAPQDTTLENKIKALHEDITKKNTKSHTIHHPIKTAFE